MSIASKFQTIAENEQKVYENGYGNGYYTGYTDGYSKGEVESGGFLWQRVRDYNSIFRDVEFPENTELVLDISNDRALLEKTENNKVYGLERAFQSAKGLKNIKIVTTEKFPFNLAYAFNSCDVETVDLGEKPLIKRMDSAFESNSNLKEVIGELDCSKCGYASNVSSSFRYCSGLETVRFKANTISFSTSFNYSVNLTDESIQSIIDGLADLTGGTAQTISWHSTVLAKLTESQIAQILGKNWSFN